MALVPPAFVSKRDIFRVIRKYAAACEFDHAAHWLHVRELPLEALTSTESSDILLRGLRLATCHAGAGAREIDCLSAHVPRLSKRKEITPHSTLPALRTAASR